MRKNKTAKTGIIVAILLLTVAFAVISTTLSINGTASIKSNNNDFEENVKFSTTTGKKPYLEVNGVTNLENEPTVSADGKSITFTAPAFDTIGDNAVLHYWIVNDSTNYDATLASLTCTKELQGEEETTEYIEIIPANSYENTTLASGETTATDDSVKVKMIRSYTGENEATYNITCTISATGKEKA